MDEAGVDRAVFVQPWFYHRDNRYRVASGASRALPRVCVIDPRGRRRRQGLARRGVTGIRPRPRGEASAPVAARTGADDTPPVGGTGETGTIAFSTQARTSAVAAAGPVSSLRVVIDHLNTGSGGWGRSGGVPGAVDLAHTPGAREALRLPSLVRRALPHRDGLPLPRRPSTPSEPRGARGPDFPHASPAAATFGAATWFPRGRSSRRRSSAS